MVLDDRHISFLTQVSYGMIRLKRGKLIFASKYVCTDKSEPVVDQTVAAQMHVLGATRIVNRGNKLFAELTERGLSILNEENEAWA